MKVGELQKKIELKNRTIIDQREKIINEFSSHDDLSDVSRSHNLSSRRKLGRNKTNK